MPRMESKDSGMQKKGRHKVCHTQINTFAPIASPNKGNINYSSAQKITNVVLRFTFLGIINFGFRLGYDL